MTNDIPLFDSLTHPTLDGNWILPRYSGQAYIEELLGQMEKYNVRWAFAVGMEGIGGYQIDRFVSMVKETAPEVLFPIAFFSFSNKDRTDLAAQLRSIKDKGYVGIKLHPRIGNIMLDDDCLPFVIDLANEMGLAVLLCTYFYSNKQSCSVNNVAAIGDLLMKVNEKSKVVLLHGGGVRLLEMMEIVRAFPNTLLDLSLTMCKYSGSSLDLDISYMFKMFDRRICVGTDHPEFSHKLLRERFDYFAEGITREKAENIAFRNINSFVDLKIDTK